MGYPDTEIYRKYDRENGKVVKVCLHRSVYAESWSGRMAFAALFGMDMNEAQLQLFKGRGKTIAVLGIKW